MAVASDYADPLHLTDPYSNITGLIIFPKDDDYIVIFNVRKSLVGPKPYPLSPYEYVVYIDLTTPVTFNSDEDRKRYGGTVVVPEQIHDDATLTVRLNDDATLKGITHKGLKNTDNIRVFTGVRDDPFIFPRLMSIPKNVFPDGQQDFILWGATSKDGNMLDLVGRSVRSQLPRFPILNSAPQNKHVELLTKEKKFWDDLCNF